MIFNIKMILSLISLLVLILVYFHFIVDIIIACMFTLQPAETIRPSVSAHDLLGLYI